MNPIEQVEAQNWQQWIADNDGVLLDVREADEWEEGTLPGAQLLAMSEIVERVDEVSRDKPILCVCSGGSRSHQVAMYLNHLGYQTANLAGGLKALDPEQ